MQAVRIMPPNDAGDGKVRAATGTRVLTEGGEEIPGITEITVHYRPEEMVTAELTVCADSDEVFALAFMSEASFFAAARRYGYEVTKKEPA